MPPPTLWTALAVYRQVRVLPEQLVPQLPLSHHRLLLRMPRVEAKVELARRSVDHGLTKRELRELLGAVAGREMLGEKLVREWGALYVNMLDDALRPSVHEWKWLRNRGSKREAPLVSDLPARPSIDHESEGLRFES